jgi:hypothetical protein
LLKWYLYKKNKIKVMAIRFTHIYDLLHKMGTMVGGFTVAVAVADILQPVSRVIEQELTRLGWTWLWIVIMWAYIIGGFIGAVYLINKTILPTWLPTFLHVRFTLFTKISPREAERLHFLFDGTLGGKWYPLGYLRKIDPDYRRETLFRFANQIASDHGWRHPFQMPEDQVSWETPRSPHGARSTEEAQGSQPPYSTTTAQVAAALRVIGLKDPPTSFEPIKQAYRRKISQFHPDKFAGERPEVIHYREETAKRLNAAYTFLERNYMARRT